MDPLLRLAAIDFLNPAPLMWDFEHDPERTRLAGRYALERMTPSACARALTMGEAELGLIPVAAYATIPGLAVVPGCAIAARGAIRSLLLVVRAGPNTAPDTPTPAGTATHEEPDQTPPTAAELQAIHTVALDTASRSTALYTQILFRRFWGHTPGYLDHAPDLDAMLASADAAVLIGDPALHALRDRAARFRRTGEQLRYLDLGALWRQATGTAWVSAFWAVRLRGLEGLTTGERQRIPADLRASRDAGLQNIPELVREWAPRLQLRPEIVEAYLTRNIHYTLDEEVLAGIHRFYAEAAALALIPGVPALRWLD